MFRVAAKSALEETAVGAGIDFTIQSSMASAACKSLGDSNPFKDCIKTCGTTNRKNSCIITEGCYEKDENGDPIYENKSLKDECYDNLLKTRVDWDAMRANLYKDVSVGVAEGVAKAHLKKGLETSGKVIGTAGRGTTTRVVGTSVGRSVGRMGGLVASKVGITYMKSQISRIVIASRVAVIVGLQAAARAAVAVGGKLGTKLGLAGVMAIIRGMGTRVASSAGMAMAKKGISTALNTLAGAMTGVGAVLSVIDGMAIALSLWDPGGWEMTIDKDMIEDTHKVYLKGYHKIFDRKVLFSETIKAEKRMAEDELKKVTAIYDKNKTPENRKKLDEAQELVKVLKSMMLKFRWKSEDRPLAHGGPNLFPAIAHPSYPYKKYSADPNAPEFIDGLEEIYYAYVQRYMDENNLVWEEQDLNEDQDNKELDKLNKKTNKELTTKNPKLEKIKKTSPNNLTKNDLDLVKQDVKKKKKIISNIDIAIKDIDDRINRYESTGRTEKADKLKKDRELLIQNKKNAELIIQQEKDIFNEVEEYKQNASNIFSSRLQSQQIIIAIFVLIMISLWYFLKKKQSGIRTYNNI